MRKRTKKKIFWGKIRDRISSVVRKINWQYIAIVAIIIIGVCVLIASYFINAIQLSIISVVFCHREPLFFMPKNFKNITKNS